MEYGYETLSLGLYIMDGIERPLKLYCDNKSVVLYSNNNRSSTKSKHIDIKFQVVKERVQSRQVSIEHIGTNSMVMDSLTKGLSPKDFHEHTTHIWVSYLLKMFSFSGSLCLYMYFGCRYLLWLFQ